MVKYEEWRMWGNHNSGILETNLVSDNSWKPFQIFSWWEDGCYMMLWWNVKSLQFDNLGIKSAIDWSWYFSSSEVIAINILLKYWLNISTMRHFTCKFHPSFPPVALRQFSRSNWRDEKCQVAQKKHNITVYINFYKKKLNWGKFN